ANLPLPVQPDGFPERTVGLLRRHVLESSIDELGRVAHVLESRASEATAERGELKDAVAGEDEDEDGAEQDLREFSHAASVASPSCASACTGVLHNTSRT